jgi:hypothetical protein
LDDFAVTGTSLLYCVAGAICAGAAMKTEAKSAVISMARSSFRDGPWPGPAERTSRHCVKYCFSTSGVSGARNALKPVEWNEIGNRHSAAAAFPADRETTGKFFVSAPKSARSNRKSPAESSSCSAFPDWVGREKLFPAAGSGRDVAGKCNSRAWMTRARAKINTIMAKVDITQLWQFYGLRNVWSNSVISEPDPKAYCVR